MAARCSFDSIPLSSHGGQAMTQGYQIGPHTTPHYSVDHNYPRNPPSIERDLLSVDYLPHLRVTEHPIGHPPASACSTGHYIASPLPFPKDAPTNAMSSLPPPSPPSPPSSPDRRIPRACHGVERRQRSRPSRGGPNYSSKLTHAERAAIKTASLRRVTFTQETLQIASSSLWTAPEDARPAPAKARRHRPPTPSPIPTRHITALSLAHVLYNCERDESPGFDADVEFEAAEVPRRDRRAHVAAKERFTIVIPGGKSEAYVAMAFERSCSLADDSDAVPSAIHRGISSSSSSSSLFSSSPSAGRLSLTSEGSEMTSAEKGKGRTGLKIKIPVPNPLFMLSLRLAGSCRVSDEEAVAECPFPGTRTHFSESSGYPSPLGTSSPSPSSGSRLDNALASRDHRRHPDHVPLLVRVDAGDVALRPPSPEGRVARRIARRAALAPYCAADRLQVPRLSKRPRLFPY